MKAKIFRYNNQWCATIDGPWYSDSNPQGFADTPEEAEKLAWQFLLATQAEINEFVAQGKPQFELIK